MSLPWGEPEHRRRRRGFSLIELLVVVGVLALLLAILAPSLSRARQSGRAGVCLSNLRQFAWAAHSYAHDHAERYPISRYAPAWESTVQTTQVWDFVITGGWSGGEFVIRKVEPGLLWRSAAQTEIHQCPSFRGDANWRGDPYTGYNYNTSYIGHGQGERPEEAPARMGDVRRPDGCALFGDGEYAGGANKFMRAPWNDPAGPGKPYHGGDIFSGRSAGTQGYRHLSRTNVAFCDGHAQSWAPRFADTYAFDRENVDAGTGFLSSDNTLYDLR